MKNDPLCERIRKRFAALKAWAWQYCPMTRGYHDKLVAMQNENHKREVRRQWDYANGQVAKAERRIDGLIDTIAKREYRSDRNFYTLQIALDPQAFGLMSPDRDGLQMLGKIIGHRVEAEIATSRFVQMARETRYREMPRYGAADFSESTPYAKP